MGEVASIIPLIEYLLERNHSIHLTVVTHTGMALAQKHFHKRIGISFLPWDLPFLPNRLIRRIQPQLLLLTETEFWPRMLKNCQRRNIPIIGINTRISDRSFPRYLATRYIWKHWLKPVQLFLAQSAQDAERLTTIGIDPEKIRTLGNLKYVLEAPNIDVAALRKRIDPSQTRPLLLLASSHEGEESAILNMITSWKSIVPNLLLIIAPRHPERFDRVGSLIEQQGYTLSQWSNEIDLGHYPDVFLLDAMGVLRQLFTIADVAIIGGSLLPIGGHNPLEAAICGRGVITGPYVENFREIMQTMQKKQAAIVCNSQEELQQCVQQLLAHPDTLQTLHGNAVLMMQPQHHLLDDYYNEIQPFIQSTH